MIRQQTANFLWDNALIDYRLGAVRFRANGATRPSEKVSTSLYLRCIRVMLSSDPWKVKAAFLTIAKCFTKMRVEKYLKRHRRFDKILTPEIASLSMNRLIL